MVTGSCAGSESGQEVANCCKLLQIRAPEPEQCFQEAFAKPVATMMSQCHSCYMCTRQAMYSDATVTAGSRSAS